MPPCMCPEVEEKWMLVNINNVPQFPMALKIISTPRYDKRIETVYSVSQRFYPEKVGELPIPSTLASPIFSFTPNREPKFRITQGHLSGNSI